MRDEEEDDLFEDEDDIDNVEDIEDEMEEEEEDKEVKEKRPAGPQDDPKVVTALNSYGARLDLNDDGWVWRVILYEKGGCDEALKYVKRLPQLRELWVIYTKVTPQAIEDLQKEMPELTIYR